ncbi:hypothetical protein CspeluHIS016_0603020 [Cutaneotrichosporon spelunceum]|uniref:Fatty acid hydroxylase domain-containing protein n=1 Tax=Cutaneotrichosporon spelunceum TaxID=1672016 RepID=A0AAD3TXR9_9TREE|nr:hypothetical protein CspeluHIS016_0603020 [Cutaneotrichosporon spelunceum]
MHTFPTHLIDSLPTMAASHNSTLLAAITPTTLDPPFYYTPRQHLFDWITDRNLSLLAPVAIYWVLSTIFHILDTLELPYFERHRIHPSSEVTKRNRVGFWTVLNGVIFQQVVQTILGLIVIDSDERLLRTEVLKDHVASMAWLAPRVADVTFLFLGKNVGMTVLNAYGARLVNFAYWWAIPTFQLLAGFCIIDTWQYWLHRTMHVYPTLYKMFHSHHHRLYVPFAFGALYNHPVEGLLLDSLGAAIAQMATFMTIRQATLLFFLSSWKTVDDHCGYKLWWDPCQLFFNNNADYHDIHHQSYGIKANFAQPFFTNWDYLLGTQMTREQAQQRHAQAKARAAKSQ